jgi:hypothetical protein
VAANAPHADDLPTFAELRGLNDEGIKGRYDHVAAGAGRKPAQASFYLEELRRRQSRRRERFMLWLTVAIAILTGANVYFVFRQSNDRPGHHDWPRYVHQHGDRGR